MGPPIREEKTMSGGGGGKGNKAGGSGKKKKGKKKKDKKKSQLETALDGNSVDLDRERANFVDNSVRYEATLRFINGQSKTILSAIQGQ